MIYPANFEEKIGFDRIREQVTALCSTPSAKAKLAEEGFSTSADEIERRLSLMNEMRSLLMLERDFPDGDYPDPAPLVAKIRVEGSYLLAAEADQLRKALVTVGAIAEFILGRGGARYPRLWELSALSRNRAGDRRYSRRPRRGEGQRFARIAAGAPRHPRTRGAGRQAVAAGVAARQAGRYRRCRRRAVGA